MLTLGHVLEALTGYQSGGGAQIITDVVMDSRLAIPGALFVALPGERTDGHLYVVWQDQRFTPGTVQVAMTVSAGAIFSKSSTNVCAYSATTRPGSRSGAWCRCRRRVPRRRVPRWARAR